MQEIPVIEEMLRDNRIDHVQCSVVKDTQILRSPGGRAIARTFALPASDRAMSAPIYTEPERKRILEQIHVVLQNYYVHLDMKQAQYGFNPVRAIDRLMTGMAILSDEEFHQSVIQIVTRTRDRHLTFVGRPTNGLSAVLPFTIERCWIGAEEIYLVTKIRADYESKHLKVGAIVSHWNGMPIVRHIRLTANLFDGGNEPASIARCLEFLSQRPLRRFMWPIESWVDLRFSVGGNEYEERFTWSGFDVGMVPEASSIGRSIIGFGGDPELYLNQLVKRAEFASDTFDEAMGKVASESDGTPTIIGRTKNFDYGSVATQHGLFAYIRIYHFAANDVDDIAKDMIDVIGKIPRNGLLIDMRGNSGGYIAAGERLLQLLTPRKITPMRFQFRVTPGTTRMMEATQYFATWKQSLEEITS